jgi:hypothetical protein
MKPRLFLITGSCAVLFSCATTRGVVPRKLRRTAPLADCTKKPMGRSAARLLFAEDDLDPVTRTGPSTLKELDVLRKTIVQVMDNYFDQSRLDPGRMLLTLVDAVVDRPMGC